MEISLNKAELLEVSQAKDINPPPVSFLWDTHKEFQDMPPTRPVCNASLGPISRTSELLSLILTPITNARSDNVDSDSTEDMLFAIEEANKALENMDLEDNEQSVFSLDAEALFPLLDLKDILDGVWDLIINTDVPFGNIEIKEMLKYIAIMYTDDELRKHNLI